jgi:uracil-DNA glycosylase family 4
MESAMRWTERQRAMLREMGIPPFWPEEPAEAVEAVSSVSDAGAAPRTEATRPSPAVAATPSAAPIAVQPPAAAPAPARPPAKSPASSFVKVAAAVPDVATLGARPEGIDRMDWPALRDAVANCHACGLCQSRTQPVFGVGHEQADWMIIGEAPGEQEDKQGEPFVGRAGQLLDRMLDAIDLTRSEEASAKQVFIANVLKCRPPANRNPQPQEVAQCEPFLMRQIELVKPKVIVAMGRFAVQSLLKSTEPIGRLRGKVHEVAGVPVVVTYHPAYLLRSPADKGLAWDDLCLAREVMARSAV